MTVGRGKEGEIKIRRSEREKLRIERQERREGKEKKGIQIHVCTVKKTKN